MSIKVRDYNNPLLRAALDQLKVDITVLGFNYLDHTLELCIWQEYVPKRDFNIDRLVVIMDGSKVLREEIKDLSIYADTKSIARMIMHRVKKHEDYRR